MLMASSASSGAWSARAVNFASPQSLGQVVGECARLIVHLSAVIEEFAIYLTQVREVDGATATRIIHETLVSYGING